MRIPALIMVATFAGAPVQAQQEEVLAAIEDQLAAWSAGDIETFATYYDPEVRGFNLDGGPLIAGFNAPMLEAALQAGFAVQFTPRDVQVRIVGSTAVSVGYLDGAITIPGAQAQEGTWRYSDTRVLTDGKWKVVQYHFSQMSPAMAPRR